MKYSVISVINGSFKIEAEFGEDLQGAIVFFLQKSATLWNAEDVKSAKIEIVDQNLNVVNGKTETIIHPVIQPEPEPEPEPIPVEEQTEETTEE